MMYCEWLITYRPDYRTRKPGLERARVHRIVYSSSESEEEQSLPTAAHQRNIDLDVIEITDSSDDDDPRRHKPPSALGQRRDQSDDDGLLVL